MTVGTDMIITLERASGSSSNKFEWQGNPDVSQQRLNQLMSVLLKDMNHDERQP